MPKWYKKNRIIALRKEKKLNQEEVANQIGCVLKTYQNYEQGHTFPTLEYAAKLAKLYNVSIDYLLGYSDYTHIENEILGNMIGLSDDAILYIQESTEYERLTLDTLLSKGYFREICIAIYNYMQTYHKEIQVQDSATGNNIFLQDSEKMEFAEYRASKHFSNLLINFLTKDNDLLQYNDYQHDLEILQNPRVHQSLLNAAQKLQNEFDKFRDSGKGGAREFAEYLKKGSD